MQQRYKSHLTWWDFLYQAGSAYSVLMGYPDDQHSGDVQVDRAYDLSSILLSYNGLTVRLDGHQAFVIMQGLAEVLNYELLERVPGEEDDA